MKTCKLLTVFLALLIMTVINCSKDKINDKNPVSSESADNYYPINAGEGNTSADSSGLPPYVLQEKIIESFQFTDLQQTKDGGYIAFYSDYGKYPKFTKFDSQFNTLWSKEYTNLKSLNFYPGSFSINSDGSFIFIITVEEGTERKAVYTKTDANGEVELQKKLRIPNGGCNYIKQTKDNGYLILGKIKAKLCNTRIGADYCGTTDRNYLVKLDSKGDTLWTKMLYDQSSDGFESWEEQGIHFIEFSGGYYILSVGGDGAMEIYKSDLEGNCIWRKGMPYSPNFFKLHPEIGLILGTNIRHVELANYFKLRLFDLEGNQQRELFPFVDGEARDVLIDSQGEMVLAGTFYNWDYVKVIGPQTYKLWLQSYNSSGELTAQWLYAGDKLREGYRIFLNQSGNFVLAGFAHDDLNDIHKKTGTFFMEVSTDCLTSTTTGIEKL